MGMGDVKLALLLGLFLGWLGLGHVALGLFLGFLLGAVGGILLIALGIKTRKDPVPFAPFLAAGAVIAVLAGDASSTTTRSEAPPAPRGRSPRATWLKVGPGSCR
jgi:leader peptidase (prepilin peptidase)/N-methyltransferase